MTALPTFTTPEDLAASTGWSPKRVRKVARGLGACRIMGNRMVLLPPDVVVIMRAAKPGVTVDDVKDWLSADAQELLQEAIWQDHSPPTGVVYFVRSGDTIKIGFTSDLAGRLAKLKTGMAHDPEVMLTIPARPSLEPYFHQKFAKHRINREWFRDAEEIREFIGRRQWNVSQ